MFKIIFAALCLLSSSAAFLSAAETYYIDFESGDNSADGKSAASAWKHAPGDANASAGPASVKLQAGDTVLFKGGVQYQGSIIIKASGAEGQHIVYDGNSQENFGKGPAVLDGGTIINTWVRCEKPEDADGNEKWKDIFYADIDLDISSNLNHGTVILHRKQPKDKMAPWQRIILCDGDQRLLPIAQYPKPKDSFFPDLPGDFLQSGNKIEGNKSEGFSTLVDKNGFLDGKSADYFDGMFIGLHGGNNHVYFAEISKFDPSAKKLQFPFFKSKSYPQTRFAIYNSVRLISNPGEWAVADLGSGKSRVYLLADKLVNGAPSNIGFPTLQTGIEIVDGASHITVDGFLIQRYSGGQGGVSIKRHSKRAQDIAVKNCEIRFLAGFAGISPNYCDRLLIENCFIHHCPGWTTAIFLNRIKDYELRNNLLVKNSGSGIRHYEGKNGHIHSNAVLDHYGMHSSTINMYEGCADILVENNMLNNVIAINRNAKNLTIRNNVIDTQTRGAFSISMWQTGSVNGRNMNDILIENNTLLGVSTATNWATSIFVQAGKQKLPEGLVIRNNIIDKLQSGLGGAGTYENNIILQKVHSDKLTDEQALLVTDLTSLLVDPENGDYRRKDGGPRMDAGANLPPFDMDWKRN